jgi:hypothetical protein
MAPILYFPHFGRRLFCTRSRSAKRTDSHPGGATKKHELFHFRGEYEVGVVIPSTSFDVFLLRI